MKLSLKIILLILLIAGGTLMLERYGNFSSLEYEKYSSKDAELNITMDYISGWRYSEHRGAYNSYAQVQFYGPLEKDFAPSIVVTAQRRSKVAFKPLTIKGMVEDLIAKRMKLKDAKVLSRSDKLRILGLETIDFALTYKKPDKLRNIDAKLIPFKERIVIFQKEDKFYTLRYMNPEQDFKKLEQAFSHCIKTIKFKQE